MHPRSKIQSKSSHSSKLYFISKTVFIVGLSSDYPFCREAGTTTGRLLAATGWRDFTTLSSELLGSGGKSDRLTGVSEELGMCSLRMTDIHLPGINSQRFRGTVSQGPVTAGDTATGRLTAMSTTGTPHLHLFKLTSPQGRPTKRKPTSTGRALAAMALPGSTTLSGSEQPPPPRQLCR